MRISSFFLLFLIYGCNLFHLDAKAEISISRDTSYTTYSAYWKIKKQYPDIKIVKPLVDNRLKSCEDIVYKTFTGDSRSLLLDIYRPDNGQIYPAVIMVHGGGWSSGDKSMERPMAQRIAMEGYVTVPVEYRLTPEAPYPAAVHDIKSAIRWVKANAAAYGIDTTKIAIEGESAGGQLAMLVAMTNQNSLFEEVDAGGQSSSIVHAAIDVDGIVDFLSPRVLNLKRKPNAADVSWLGGTFDEKPQLWKEASPIFWVNERSVPVAFIVSGVARFHAGRDEMVDMLNHYGIYSERHQVPDSPHSFWMYEPWFEPTRQYILGFLRQVFGK